MKYQIVALFVFFCFFAYLHSVCTFPPLKAIFFWFQQLLRTQLWVLYLIGSASRQVDGEIMKSFPLSVGVFFRV